MNFSVLKPISILSGILGTVAVMAGTNMFNPLIKFIHQDAITPAEGMLCILFTILGFAGCYVLLNMLCTYFVPRIESKQKHTISRVKNNS